MDTLSEVVTHYSGQLSEVAPNDRVRIAGLITKVRHYQSKAGKPMGFVTLEDLQGTVELVVFPRVWERVENIIEFDKIVLVDGRVDLDGAEPKLIVDNLTAEFSMVVGSQSPKQGQPIGKKETTEKNRPEPPRQF